MKDIKFRGKISAGLENAGQWVYWDVRGTDLIDCIDPDTIGQFTGRRDKNGREIWEKDRIKYTHYECYPQNTEITEILTVEWKNSGFYPLNYLNESANIEVIGNVWEGEK